MWRTVCAAALLAAFLPSGRAGAQEAAPDVVVGPAARGPAATGALDLLRQTFAAAPTVRVEQSSPQGGAVLVVNGGGIDYRLVSLPQARLTALAVEATRRMEADSKDRPSALVELRAPFAAAPTRAIKGANLFLGSLWSGSALFAAPQQPAPLKVNESFAFALERARTLRINLNLDQLQRLLSSDSLAQVAARRPALAPFSTSYRRTMQAFGGILATPGPATQETLRQTARDTTQAFIDSWPRLRNDPEARREAVHALEGLARQSELKAVYGVSSNFHPIAYREIYRQAGRAVAVLGAQDELICSGVAITDAWILTAGHCFMGRAWQGTQIRTLQPDGAPGPVRPVRQLWPDPAPGSRGADTLDYTFVRIDPSPELSATEGRPAPCLRTKPAVYEEAVAVVGYAASDELVYDHAYVWYPFRLYDAEYQRVAAMTGARLQRLAEAFYPRNLQKQEDFIQANLRSFDAAYATRVGSGATQQREYRGRAADVAADRPMFGFDTDTQSGNSGGPVYARRDVCIVGVFGGGRPDNVQISEATWKEHEFATPIAAVIQDAEARGAAGVADPSDAGQVQALLAALAAATR